MPPSFVVWPAAALGFSKDVMISPVYSAV